MYHKKTLSPYISLISIMSSIYFILSFFNLGFPIIGIEGAKPISFSESFAILVGYIFGWEIGLLSTTIGGLILGLILPIPPFYIFNFIPAAFSSFMSGFINKHFSKSILLYIILLVIYASYPYIGVFWLYPPHLWFHIIVLIITLATGKWYYQNTLKMKKIVIFIYSLFSSLVGQLSGTILFEVLYYPNIIPIKGFKYIWMITTFLYPLERVFLALTAFIIIFPTLTILSKYKFLSSYIE